MKRQVQGLRFKQLLRLQVLVLTLLVLTGCTNSNYESGVWEDLFLDGETAMGNSEYQMAKKSFTEAVSTARKFKAPDLRLPMSLDRLALLEFKNGDTDSAEKLWQEGTGIYPELRKRSHHDDDLIAKEFAHSETSLAKVKENANDMDHARKLYNSALAEIKHVSQTSGTGDLLLESDRLRCMIGLASIALKSGHFQEAVGLCRNAQKAPYIPSTLQLQINDLLQQAFAKQGNTSAANEILDNSKNDALRVALEEKWRQDFQSGERAVKNGDYAVAETLFWKALPEAESLGKNDALVIQNMDRLIRVSRIRHNFVQAESLSKRALSVADTVTADDGNILKDIDNLLKTITSVYEKQHHYVDEEIILKRQLKLRQQLRGENNPHVAETLQDLGRLYFDQHKYSAAEPVLLKALHIFEKFGGDRDQTLETAKFLENTYLAENKTSLAEDLRKKFDGEQK